MALAKTKSVKIGRESEKKNERETINKNHECIESERGFLAHFCVKKHKIVKKHRIRPENGH